MASGEGIDSIEIESAPVFTNKIDINLSTAKTEDEGNL